MPAQFLRADGLSVQSTIKTSELIHWFVINVKEADMMMCDGKRRKCKIILLESLITYNSRILINMLFSIPARVITTALKI